MKGIDELIDLTNKSFNCDPWIKEKGLAKFASYLVEESNEAVDAIKNNDNENLKEELGDILSVWLTTCKLANFDKNEIINIAINKIKHRRPYVLDNRKVTMDQAIKFWYDAKDEEKRLKNNN